MKSRSSAGLDRGGPGHAQRCFDAAALAKRQFLGKQGVDGFEGRGFAALDLAHDVIERLQRARHLEADGSRHAEDHRSAHHGAC